MSLFPLQPLSLERQDFQPEGTPFRAVVFSGPLGSGKTTLFNSFLERVRESIGSYVIIENDIGSNNVDKTRLEADPSRILALTSGCICCNDITSFRVQVSCLKDLPVGDRPETLLVETTGIAYPSEIKRALYELNVPSLLVVTVDVAHFARNELLRSCEEGIRSADVVAFTWWDGLKDPAILANVVRRVESINPIAHKIFVKADGEVFEVSHEAQVTDGVGDTSPCEMNENLVDIYSHWSSNGALTTPYPISEDEKKFRAEHTERSISLSFLPKLSADEVIEAIVRVTGDTLIRVKGSLGREDVDCTHGDWSRSIREHGVSNTVNVITTRKIDLTQLDEFLQNNGSSEEIDLSNPEVLKEAIDLVEELIRDFPKDVISLRGNLTTECDSGEGWRYIYLEGFPEDIRNRFLTELVQFYHKQLQTLESGVLATHPSLPFYRKEVAANVSWLLIDCVDLLSRLGIREEIEGSRPFSMYFSGLSELTLPSQLNKLRPQDLSYLESRIEGLIREVGEEESVKWLLPALKNVERLSFDGSWKKAREVFSRFLEVPSDSSEGPQGKTINSY